MAHDGRVEGDPSKVLKALLLLSGMPHVLAYGVIVPALASISAELATDNREAYMIKMLTGIIGPASIVGSLLAGYLTDRCSCRPLWLFFTFVFVASGAAPALVAHVPAILALRLITGIAAAALATMGTALIGDYIDEAARPTWMGWIHSSGIVVAIFMMPLAGLLGDLGWRWCFLLYLAALPLVLLVLFTRLDPPRSMQLATLAAGRTEGRVAYPVGLILLALLVGISNVPGLFISFYLEEIGLGRPSTVGTVLMLNAIVGAVLASLFGTVRRYFSPKVLLCFSFAVMSLGIAILAAASTLALAITALLVMGIGMAWLAPNLMALVVESAKESHRARAVGAVSAALAVAPAVGITILDPVIASFGMLGILIASAAVAGITALTIALSPWRPQRAASAA